jgi:DNA-binding transcriptional ArsR family regulator
VGSLSAFASSARTAPLTPPPGEVRVRLGDADEIAVRVAISPMATVLASIFEALLGVPRGAPETWYEHIRRQAGDMADVFAPIYRSGARVFPDFVAPNPIGPRASFEEELAAMRNVPPDRTTAAIRCLFPDDRPPAYDRFLRDPEGSLAALVDALAEYWARVFERQWPTMESILEREVLALGSRLVSEGAGALLARLHPRITLHAGTLQWASDAIGHEIELAHHKLLIAPMLSGPDAIMSSLTDAGAVIAYAAPGTSLLWEAADGTDRDGLGQVLGPTRARVMLAVAMPASTVDVAHQLEMSNALASHHLKALEDQGLVDGVRFGRRVYYRLTARGQRLRDALAG